MNYQIKIKKSYLLHVLMYKSGVKGQNDATVSKEKN